MAVGVRKGERGKATPQNKVRQIRVADARNEHGVQQWSDPSGSFDVEREPELLRLGGELHT